MSGDLKPCPFCFSASGGVFRFDGRWFYACPCGVQGPHRDSRDEATAAWNTRAAWPDLRPMSEAPKDGTYILACRRIVNGLPCDFETIRYRGYPDDFSGPWVAHHGSTSFSDGNFDGWLPLPKLPQGRPGR